MPNILTIGTRGSPLACAQAEIVREALRTVYPQLDISFSLITTTGDKNQTPIPLDMMGKSWFTREIEQALLDRRVDLAVHSLKDLPEVCPQGLTIAAILKREDPRDVLISKEHIRFADLPRGSVIGTDSARRQAQVLAARPDLRVRSIRGNIHTRLEKMDRGEFAALILAAAGLKRLGKTHRIAEYFSVADMLPAPGQGALAIQTRADNLEVRAMVRRINHEPSARAAAAERAFAQTAGGGCKTPVAAYATVENGQLTISGMIASTDGKHMQRDSLSSPVSEAEMIGRRLAKRMLQQVRPLIVLTRPKADSIRFARELEARGFRTYSFPCIRIVPVTLTPKQKQTLTDILSFDWIVFTSSNGVTHFLTHCVAADIHRERLRRCRIAAVGPKTAEKLTKHGLTVDFLPTSFETAAIARELPDVRGKRILLLRSAIAGSGLKRTLTRRGADTVSLPMYTAGYIAARDGIFETLLRNTGVDMITFTSSSTVTGFMKRMEHVDSKLYRHIPVLCIGPVTARRARIAGFTIIYVSRIYTVDGMIEQLRRARL